MGLCWPIKGCIMSDDDSVVMVQMSTPSADTNRGVIAEDMPAKAEWAMPRPMVQDGPLRNINLYP